jgi:CheY-like chemotaxis protein
MAKVLIVDDNKQLIRMMSTVLTYLGHEPMGLLDGESGLQAASQDRPDLVFLDFMMPGKDGLETLQEFRESPGFDHVPIFILTASHDQVLRERALNAGATGFLNKPLRIDDLESVIESHIEPVRVPVAA